MSHRDAHVVARTPISCFPPPPTVKFRASFLSSTDYYNLAITVQKRKANVPPPRRAARGGRAARSGALMRSALSTVCSVPSKIKQLEIVLYTP